MLPAARDAVQFADGMAFDEFKQSRLHQNAILKSIEIVGEAAARISSETRGQHSEISWPEITAMRNRLVHAYFDVDLRACGRSSRATFLVSFLSSNHWYLPRTLRSLRHSLTPPDSPR